MESIVLQEKGVVVKQTLVGIGARSYPINAIASVVVVRPRRLGYFALGGVLFAFGFLILLSAGLSNGPKVLIDPGFAPFWLPIILIGAALIAWGYLLPYGLLLRTSSGEQRALSSRDANFLFKIKQSIERAVTMRG